MAIQTEAKFLKILTVEDSSIVAIRLQSMFSELDKVTFIGNAPDIATAKLFVNNIRPDVVILDIHLATDAPQSSGITLLTWLRAHFPDIIIIMLTNLVEPQYRQICSESGAHHFLDKSKEFDKVPKIIAGIRNIIN